LQVNVGFHAGFAVAAVGMFVGLVIYFITNKKYLGLAGIEVPDPLNKEEKARITKIVAIVVIIAAIVCLILSLFDQLTLPNFANFISVLGVLLPIYYFIKLQQVRKLKTMSVQECMLIYRYLLQLLHSG